MPFGLGGKEAALTAAGYDELVFAVFVCGYILVLVLFIVLVLFFVLVLVFIHQCLYCQGCSSPGGSTIIGWWQGREVAGSGAGK